MLSGKYYWSIDCLIGWLESYILGIYPPTSGTATILGRDIVRDMDEIRTSIGFCPQHDILYGQLNVKEHLEIIASVR
jgi:ATP-binding cassette subfamily A (ABC1) protein 3